MIDWSQMRTKAQIEQQRLNREAMDYLALTDWYAIRLAETGKPIPEEIAERRAKARATIKT